MHVCIRHVGAAIYVYVRLLPLFLFLSRKYIYIYIYARVEYILGSIFLVAGRACMCVCVFVVLGPQTLTH